MERYDPSIHACPLGMLCAMSVVALMVFLTALLLFG
ncbi:hypothetical protein V474_15575 [Novosphingobium barchaimii LL02]|uniref:Uncharacterized protein n=1 Tax=Novosphingobium barchaimii LL02 TaxID=1114963 RepID=A0A0J8AQG6_9SPHN|nr:hypothetical protein V474_15575 [Novosphingobium barchaimii LL02]